MNDKLVGIIADNEGKPCHSCGDTMTHTHSNFVPMWSDFHDNIVCSDCFYDKNAISNEQYLIWNDDGDYHIVSKLPDGSKLTTQGDDTHGFIVDVSHWDAADLYEFEQAEDGDKVAQLEGLVEYQTYSVTRVTDKGLDSDGE